MKIIYTNLQEIDGNVTRSARQLRIDFGGSGKEGAGLRERGEARHDNSLLPARGGPPDLRRVPERQGDAPCEAKEDGGERKRDLREGTPPALRNANAAAHLLVRRFVEAQMCSGQAIDRQCRIDIFV